VNGFRVGASILLSSWKRPIQEGRVVRRRLVEIYRRLRQPMRAIIGKGVLIEGRCHAADSGHESISMAGDRHDVVVLIGTLTKGAPQRRYLTDEVVLLDGRIGPHQIQQLILADYAVAVVEQHHEHVERLGRDRHPTVAAPQTALDGVDDERTERAAAVLGSMRSGRCFAGRFGPISVPHGRSLFPERC
jgi:hypothetical protein